MSNLSDDDRADFLQRLDDSDEIEVSAWEAQFLESNLDRKTFTEAQRRSIDRMFDEYNPRLR